MLYNFSALNTMQIVLTHNELLFCARYICFFFRSLKYECKGIKLKLRTSNIQS